MFAWMIRAILVSGMITAGAYCFERALHARGLATRFAWLFAIIASLALPFVPRIASAPVMPNVLAIAMPALELARPINAESNSSLPISLLLWIALSVAAVLVYVVSYVRLRNARREWHTTSLEEHLVLISQRYGPAVCGFRRPRIVVPSWVLAASALEQRLIVMHESQHIRAGDHLLVLASLAATIVMPWNPFVWLQIRRMRFAIEADCDQRVLACTTERQEYASLLVDVGSRHSGLLLSPALAEQRHGLEKRIAIMAASVVRHRWRALAFVVVGLVLTIASCESRMPLDPVTAQPDQQPEASNMKVRSPWIFGEKEYPAEFRLAGVAGTVGLSLHVTDNGVADQVIVNKSSGHEALDAAAIKAARSAQWANEGPGKHTDYWTRTSVTFDPRPRVPLPASEIGKTRPRMTEQPSFTPYTVKPELQNRDEVSRALVRSYPPALRDAGIGGQILIWVLLDETGQVVKSQVKTTSGEMALDAAALKVANVMRFSPALNGTEPVPVWIQLPIVFRTN